MVVWLQDDIVDIGLPLVNFSLKMHGEANVNFSQNDWYLSFRRSDRADSAPVHR